MQMLIINGSLGGANGNTARILASFRRLLELDHVTVNEFHLTERAPSFEDLAAADGFVFATGVYWDSWSSVLQKFFESSTPLEGANCWFGKPVAAIVTMHSVGGKEVLSRLQGVLNTFGLYFPPMSAMTYSLANQMALQVSLDQNATRQDTEFEKDLWCLDDLAVLATNLKLAAQNRTEKATNWRSWPVDRSDPSRVWFSEVIT